MARRKKKTAPRKGHPIVPGRSNAKMSRREMLSLAKFGAFGTAIVGAGGFYFATRISTAMAEEDMTRLGNGVPTVVQVHDPGCSQCIALQRQVRQAMDTFDTARLQYVVANIHTPEGRAFADQHGVGHVTLVLLDGRGRVRDVITGVRTSDALLERFRRVALKQAGTG